MVRPLKRHQRATAVHGAIGPATAPGSASFAGLLLAWFLLGLTVAPARPLLPVYVDAVLRRPPLFTSTLLALQLAGGAAGALAGGSIADALGRKVALVLGSLSAPLAAALFLTRATWLMIGLSLALGVLSSVQTIGGQTYMMGAVRQVRLGSAAALFFIGSTLGTSLGNLLAGKALDRWGFSAVALAMLLTSALVLLGTAWLLPEPRREGARAHAPLVATVAGYRRITRRREVRLLVGLRLLPTCYWGVATLLIPLLLYRASGRPSTAAFYAGLSLALAAGCQLLTGRVADRVGRRAPAAVLTALIAAAAVLTGLFAGSVAGLYLCGILGACAAWSLSTLMPGLIKELAEPREEGRTLALTHLVWSSAMLAGTLAGGGLVAMGGALPFLLVGALNVPAVLMALALPRPRLAVR